MEKNRKIVLHLTNDHMGYFFFQFPPAALRYNRVVTYETIIICTKVIYIIRVMSVSQYQSKTEIDPRRPLGKHAANILSVLHLAFRTQEKII